MITQSMAVLPTAMQVSAELEVATTATSKKSESIKTTAKATLQQVIEQQHTTGYWPLSAKDSFKSRFFDGFTDDLEVLVALEEFDSLSDPALKDQVFVTLLAIYLLQEAFGDSEDEWTLLARKAKTYLKSVGVDKPDKLIKKFTLQVLE